MKKKITTGILLLATAFGFAQEAIPVLPPNIVPLETTPSFIALEQKVAPRKSFGYLKMGVSDTELNKLDTLVLPGFGLGFRINSDASAIDISVSYNYVKRNTENGRSNTLHYTLPKASYLHYFSTVNPNSFYAGLGLAWGGIDTKRVYDTAEEPFLEDERNAFIGLIPNFTLGYEFNRTGTLHSFIQFDVSQPAFAAYQDGDFPKAFAELSLGAGF